MQELKQRLASPPAELTPAERKVVRALLVAESTLQGFAERISNDLP
ncbi:hypothetical protein, partial [Pseudomonas aeruginosa]